MHNPLQTSGWNLADWQAAQKDGQGLQRLQALLAVLKKDQEKDTAWIALAEVSGLEADWQQLEARQQAGETLPLMGVPFAIKDNIDAKGWPTTAACPAFSYQAEKDAQVVAELKQAGAILIGKTNLDQFATGLVGTRSPYGAVPNSFNPDYVSGGSSSGSASVVARGLVPFALGTDTAGSGRVPAGFNNIVGLKPTRGWLSTSGVVPACRTLDCVSVFALTVEDALQVAELAAGATPDASDPWSRTHPQTTPVALPERPRLAIPANLEFFGDRQMQTAFAKARAELETLAELVEIDFSAFSELAALLYQGPWVAERTHALGSLLDQDPSAIDPSVYKIVSQGVDFSALDYFAAEYRRQELSRQIQQQLAEVDALVVPTSPTIRTLAEMEKEPLVYNSQFGTYTNFTNLADLSALALPAGFRDDGLPAGITLIATAWQDRALAEFGQRWQAQQALPLGATQREYSTPSQRIRPPAPGAVRLAVVGAHLTGMPLNFQLTSRDARLVEATETAADYRLYALANTTPPKPGLVKVADQGAAIKVELWDLPLAHFGAFVEEIPQPLGIGNLTLKDGRVVKGFICEPLALQSATDITHLGGWRAYIAELNKQKEASA
ncbi:allophanate hydrolase [Marinospirillum celere]|uniref:Allophanate hydrolase n=1 Tax=Marinospirillum celere TaxID=1122252 RepID=A0A1I1JJ22_9GAMM|nr:allophanate hydrolase [Marinospirillum celere]SFC45460.1 allophanate hydrolase [Marinospirillum celere]